MDGVTAITRMAERGLAARVLVLTTYDTDSDVLPAIEAGRHRLPAQGHPARGTVPGGTGGRPGRGGAVAVGGQPADGPAARPGPGAAEPARVGGARAGRPRLLQPGGGGAACSSARPPSRPTCCTSTPSSASTTGPPPWPPPSNAACCPAPELGRTKARAGALSGCSAVREPYTGSSRKPSSSSRCPSVSGSPPEQFTAVDDPARSPDRPAVGCW